MLNVSPAGQSSGFFLGLWAVGWGALGWLSSTGMTRPPGLSLGLLAETLGFTAALVEELEDVQSQPEHKIDAARQNPRLW